MIRYLLIFSLLFSPLFAKKQMEYQECGCPSEECYEVPEKKRKVPAPLSGVSNSVKSCPGIWLVSAVALTIYGVAYLVSDGG